MADSKNTLERHPKDIELIWKHTHKDFRGMVNGHKTVMYPAPYFCSGTIAAMPEELFQEELKYAQRKEVGEICDNALRPIMEKHGLLNHFESTMQWRDSLESVKTYASFVLCNDSSKLDDLVSDIVNSDVIFPDSEKG